jgi:hypothetical protein
MLSRLIAQRLPAIKNGLASKDANLALKSAFELLNIDPEQFAKIRSVTLRKQLLLYRYLNAEFKFSDPSYKELSTQLIPLIEQAYHLILTSPCTTRCEDPDSPSSYGLTGLAYRSLHHHANAKTDVNLLDQSVLQVGKKEAGVQPGFKARLKEDLFLAIYKKYPTKNERLKFYREQKHSLEQLYKIFEPTLPPRLFKNTHKEIDSSYRIVVEAEDVKRSGKVKRYYSKGKLFGMAAVKVVQIKNAKPFDDVNCDSAMEVIANDIARLFMPVQNQTLLQGRYANGLMQLMLETVENKNARDLGPLAGDAANNQSYCVKPVLHPVDDKIKYLSDDSILHLAEYFAIMAIQGDYDGIGTNGQNKMRDGNSIYGIDFGHAYQLSIIDLLENNFHFKHPKFVNYSVFYDAPRSDIVRGLIKVAALGKVKVDDNILRSYGEDFKQEVDKLYALAGTDEDIFDNYIRKFKELETELGKGDEPEAIRRENVKCCKKIIATLQTTRDRHVLDRNKLIAKFRHYLSLEAPAIDLQENIEKLCTPNGKLSLRSPDSQVLLNHLRVEDTTTPAPEWTLRTASLGQKYVLTSTFGTPALAAQAMARIKEMAEPLLYVLQQEGKTLSMTFNKESLPVLNKLFHEDKIKEKYCADDYKLYLHYKAEAALKQQLENLSQYGATAAFAPDDKNAFSLVIKASPNQKLDPLFAYFFRKHLCKLAGTFTYENNEFHVHLPADEIVNLHKALTQLPIDIAAIKTNFEQLSNFTQTFNPFGSEVSVELEAGDECIVTFSPLPPQGFDSNFNYFFRKHLDTMQADYIDNGQVVKVVLEFSKLAAFNQTLKQIPEEVAAAKANYASFNKINLSMANNARLGKHLVFLLTTQADGYQFELLSLSTEPDAKRYLQMAQIFLSNNFHADAKNRTKLSVSFDQLPKLNAALTEFHTIFNNIQAAQNQAPAYAFYPRDVAVQRNDSQLKTAANYKK